MTGPRVRGPTSAEEGQRVSLDAIFKAYDIRGVYPDEIDEAIARRVGNAFARFTGAARILVARDMRPSSIPLSEAFAEGATLAAPTSPSSAWRRPISPISHR